MSLPELFIQKQWTLSLAESCTGGSIAAKLVEKAGASNYFMGSLVVYSNTWKEKLLRIPSALLEKEGAVSSQCAALMASNLYTLSKTDWTGSITGIAGPAGGTPSKPVGTVFMAVCYRGGAPSVKSFHFAGSRLEIIRQAQEAFLSFLNESILFYL